MKIRSIAIQIATFLLANLAFAQNVYPIEPNTDHVSVQPFYADMYTRSEFLAMDGELVTSSPKRVQMLVTGFVSIAVYKNGQFLPFPEGGQLMSYMNDKNIPYEEFQGWRGVIDKKVGKPMSSKGTLVLKNGQMIETSGTETSLDAFMCRGEERSMCISAAPVGIVMINDQVEEGRLWGRFSKIEITRDSAAIAQFKKVVMRRQQDVKLDNWRRSLREGVDTQCGMVVQSRVDIAEVQEKRGTRWLRRNELFPANSGQRCTN